MDISSIRSYISKNSKNKSLTESSENTITLQNLSTSLSKILGHLYEVTVQSNNNKINLTIKYTSRNFNQSTHYILDFVMLMNAEYYSWKLVKKDALPTNMNFPKIETRNIVLSNEKIINWFKVNRTKLDRELDSIIDRHNRAAKN